MIALRSLVFNLVFYAVLIGMMIAGLPLLLAPPQIVRNYVRLWGRISVWLLARICGTSVEIRGAHHVPHGGFILAAKHQSFLDIVALLPLVPQFVYVMKRELMWIPMFGTLAHRAGMIPVDRARGRAGLGELAMRVAKAVRSGHQLIIFPEGTRRPPGAPPQYKAGVAHLYAGTGVPCLPVALNSGLFWPRRSFLRLPGRMVVDVLPPIAPGLDKTSFLRELERRIETASNAMLGETVSNDAPKL